ncbi:MAG: alpha/beta fold hydrolase [Halioglobus sp.]
MARAYPRATGKLCVFVHGLASTEWLWTFSSAEYYNGATDVSFGSRLYEELGYTPVYIRYNTGLHISDNGRRLAELIGELVDAYPVPIEEIALIGHSMGGLVARSAASHAAREKLPWVRQLRHVACVGAPNLGAPLEKVVHLLTGVLRRVDAAGAQVPARLPNSRSAGVKDLRHGYTVTRNGAGQGPGRRVRQCLAGYSLDRRGRLLLFCRHHHQGRAPPPRLAAGRPAGTHTQRCRKDERCDAEHPVFQRPRVCRHEPPAHQ